MPFDGSRAELYRQYAERIRTQATNPKAKEIFEEIARLYDMLATGVERPLFESERSDRSMYLI
jgi:hypothetical protein